MFQIIKNLLLDKPISFIFFLLLILLFSNLVRKKKLNFETYTYLGTIGLNFILIFLLYISVWQNMELESPIRYILNLLHLVLISLFILLDKAAEDTN